MKSPLRYQVTHFDCGTTSLINAFMYLFEREEIPLEVIRHIEAVTSDNRLGSEHHVGGTSVAAFEYIHSWLSCYAKRTGFPVVSKHTLESQKLLGDFDYLKQLFQKNAHTAIVAGCCLGGDHYVLITGYEETNGDTVSNSKEQYIKVFDPYYDTWPLHELDVEVQGVKPVFDRPFTHNRLVEPWVFLAPAGTPYSLATKTQQNSLILQRI